ncbi:MAG: VTT domain-containing protein [Coriobacteriia bacterium]|nr:VTT domain-containing protein [Coriobacteriia bacterium]
MANKVASRGNILRLAGLIAILVAMGVAAFMMWPAIRAVFEQGGIDGVVNLVKDQGSMGMFAMIGVQVLQIIVAPIPGEVVEVAAGMIYGSLLGTLLLTVGNIIASSLIFLVVHKLGAPFVQEMVSTKSLDRFYEFEHSGKLSVLTFILFLLPGMPKDTFTYLLALTSMEMKQFLILTTTARLPVLFATLLVADGYADGNLVLPTVVLIALVVASVVGIAKRDFIMSKLVRKDA